jgi:hypothetical protein
MGKISRYATLAVLASVILSTASYAQIDPFEKLVPTAQMLVIGKVLSLEGQ